MRALVEAGVQEAVLEGGPTLAGALVSEDLVDSVVWLIGPVLLGAGLATLPSLPAPRRLSVRSVVMLGADVKIEGVVDVHGNS
jgi:diaminohydroxyphosphoribosylaminopyrimidine deaminase/5-amino-6-(5-phosphoribosylamino)uracil reductase